HSLHFFFFFMLPPLPRSTLFPYTTLFRSFLAAGDLAAAIPARRLCQGVDAGHDRRGYRGGSVGADSKRRGHGEVSRKAQGKIRLDGAAARNSTAHRSAIPSLHRCRTRGGVRRTGANRARRGPVCPVSRAA